MSCGSGCMHVECGRNTATGNRPQVEIHRQIERRMEVRDATANGVVEEQEKMVGQMRIELRSRLEQHIMDHDVLIGPLRLRTSCEGSNNREITGREISSIGGALEASDGDETRNTRDASSAQHIVFWKPCSEESGACDDIGLQSQKVQAKGRTETGTRTERETKGH